MSLSLTPTLTRHDVERIHQHSLDLLERVGIGGHYLTQRETRNFTRSEYVPMWPPEGKTAMEVVHEEALDILHNHQRPPLPEGAADKIEAIVAEVDKALA